jgi:hypothetical protein
MAKAAAASSWAEDDAVDDMRTSKMLGFERLKVLSGERARKSDSAHGVTSLVKKRVWRAYKRVWRALSTYARA